MSVPLFVPPQVWAGFTVTAGFAVLCRSALVAATSRSSAGRADQSSATTPTTCGPAIEVPLKFAYDVSLELIEERTLTPGAEMFGFKRCEPSVVTSPRLLKPASVLAALSVVAPVEKAAS